MIQKLFFTILILVGVGGIAGVVLLIRSAEDVELWCQINMQFARLTNAMINRNGTFPIIEDAKETCEWRKEAEKRQEEIEKERREYYSNKSRDYGN